MRFARDSIADVCSNHSMPEAMPRSTPNTLIGSHPAGPRLTLGMPVWLVYSLLTTILWGAWGAVSKLASGTVDANTNQIYFTVGLVPIVLALLRSPRLKEGKQFAAGSTWAFVTGLLGGLGNIAFFYALYKGGKVSVVAPVTALFPIVTVLLAMAFLRERLNGLQKVGFALALAAIYLLSM
jgi:transporter family protein